MLLFDRRCYDHETREVSIWLVNLISSSPRTRGTQQLNKRLEHLHLREANRRLSCGFILVRQWATLAFGKQESSRN